ncbi:unnamed protein product [Colias eurytheme]|nr:unnamed protein product [Colias eurytheme]
MKKRLRKDEDDIMGSTIGTPVNSLSKRKNVPSKQRDFVIYEIGEPDILHEARIQLYEKMSTIDGKTMWNDFTKLIPASISTVDPEWNNQDLTIRYRTKDFLSRENYTLPSGSLCLVLPLNYVTENLLQDNRKTEHKLTDQHEEFIIVPIDDIIMIKSNRKNSQSEINKTFESPIEYINERRRRVVIRTTRALLAGSLASLDILEKGTDSYLKLPHRTSHRTQLDLEAKADDNKLVVAGSSGRLTSIVSDTRKTRSTLNLQVTNTGLAASYYRISVRDCLTDSQEIHSSDGITTKLLIPPMHTKPFQLEIPLDSSFTDALCSVSLMNDDDESVAVRDVRIKKNDRCFCIWHCECVCITEDPRLTCKDMPDAQLIAAGHSPREESRYIRSLCYPDIITLNLFVIFFGVLIALLVLGILKAFLGLCCRCTSSWGLELLFNSPRKLDHYYESSLRRRTLVYDKDGWPVHPDTKQRTVRLVSKPMEFILNTIFFIVLPCILLWDTIKEITSKLQNTDKKVGSKSRKNIKKCFSTQDMQSKEFRWRRHKGGLRKWMTPQAENLSTDIWQYGLPGGRIVNNCMQPLLNETPFCGKLDENKPDHNDSDQDDTEFVIMQMQKSKESLAVRYFL